MVQVTDRLPLISLWFHPLHRHPYLSESLQSFVDLAFWYSMLKSLRLHYTLVLPFPSYNKKLNCIDAFMVFGGSQTVFMKIRSDTLWAFAKVNLTDRIIITEIDAHGKETELRNDNYDTEDSYVRFSNYKPLTKNESNY